MSGSPDTVTAVDRARQEKEALIEELRAALERANQRYRHADSWALGFAANMLAPGQFRALIDAVDGLSRRVKP